MTTSKSIILVGNPNVGKSLIFNQLTGANQAIANFPGITLTHTSGYFTVDDVEIKVTDLPGIYGFSAGKIEEEAGHNYILNESPDLIVNVINSTHIERNLYLTLQLLEMHPNMLIVLSFKDKVNLDFLRKAHDLLEIYLKVPIITISAYDADDIRQLRAVIKQQIDNPHPAMNLDIFPELNNLFALIESTVAPSQLLLDTQANMPLRWKIITTLLNGDHQISMWPDWMVRQIKEQTKEYFGDKFIDFGTLAIDLINHQYQFIAHLLQPILPSDDYHHTPTFSERVDKLLLNAYFGIPLFILIMLGVFISTFQISAPISDFLVFLIQNSADWIHVNIPNDFLASFLADAVFEGIGFVMVFIPQIAILFFFISIMEHSGYLSRVVFILDRFVNKLGITGTSIAPLLLGFGCNIPAIMATRAIRDENEKIAVALANPFISCSARLPVYIVIAGALFPHTAGIIIAALYFMGIILALSVLFVLRKTILPGDTPHLLLELPDLAIPKSMATLSRVYVRLKRFIYSAGSWMAGGIIMLWLLSVFGPIGYLGSDALHTSDKIAQSWLYMLGHFLQPIFAIFHWDSRLIVALIFGFIAKEIVVSAFGLLYGVSDVGINVVIVSAFTPASALAFLFFVLTYTPCLGTFFAMKQEIGKKWAFTSIGMNLIIAYTLAIIVYFGAGVLL